MNILSFVHHFSLSCGASGWISLSLSHFTFLPNLIMSSSFCLLPALARHWSSSIIRWKGGGMDWRRPLCCLNLPNHEGYSLHDWFSLFPTLNFLSTHSEGLSHVSTRTHMNNTHTHTFTKYLTFCYIFLSQTSNFVNFRNFLCIQKLSGKSHKNNPVCEKIPSTVLGFQAEENNMINFKFFSMWLIAEVLYAIICVHVYAIWYMYMRTCICVHVYAYMYMRTCTFRVFFDRTAFSNIKKIIPDKCTWHQLATWSKINKLNVLNIICADVQSILRLQFTSQPYCQWKRFWPP